MSEAWAFWKQWWVSGQPKPLTHPLCRCARGERKKVRTASTTKCLCNFMKPLWPRGVARFPFDLIWTRYLRFRTFEMIHVPSPNSLTVSLLDCCICWAGEGIGSWSVVEELFYLKYLSHIWVIVSSWFWLILRMAMVFGVVIMECNYSIAKEVVIRVTNSQSFCGQRWTPPITQFSENSFSHIAVWCGRILR